MKKEPIALYIIRIITGLGLLTFMCMLYWSSSLIEQNLQGLQSEINEVKAEFKSVESTMNTMRDELLEALKKQTS
jgi:outer membrane lipoprotein-sorting protein